MKLFDVDLFLRRMLKTELINAGYNVMSSRFGTGRLHSDPLAPGYFDFNNEQALDFYLQPLVAVYGRGPHDCNGKIIQVGQKLCVSCGSRLIKAYVLDTTPTRVTIKPYEANGTPHKGYKRTLGLPERMMIL